MNMKTIIKATSFAILLTTAISANAATGKAQEHSSSKGYNEMTINGLVMPLRVEDVVNYQNIYQASAMEAQNGQIVLVAYKDATMLTNVR